MLTHRLVQIEGSGLRISHSVTLVTDAVFYVLSYVPYPVFLKKTIGYGFQAHII